MYVKFNKRVDQKSPKATCAAYVPTSPFGVIRGITDQHTILYIQDILVRPDHQVNALARS